MSYLETDSPINLNSGSGCNGGGFMNGDSPFWAIILLAIIFGWNGNRGYGGFGGGSSDGGVMNNYVLTSDFSQLSRQIDSGFASQERKLDGINNGLCSLGYQELQNITGVNQNISNGVFNLSNAITTGGYETRNAISGVSSQLANCCCETREAIQGVRYDLATNTCAITNAINNSTRDIVDNANNNTKSILDFLVNEKITSLQAENAGLKAQISNDRQSAYIIDALAPKCPQASYVVQPPQTVTFPTNCCGTANVGGCGCGNIQ